MTIDVRGAEPTVAPGAAVGTGIVAGLLGGVGFGIFMQARGMLPLVANLVGGSTAGLGWLVHLAISVFVGVTFSIIGVGFALVVVPRANGLVASTLLGMGYGAFWWILGGLLLMPLWLGMEAFTLNATAWASLAGHLIYGLLLGSAYGLVASRLARRHIRHDSRRHRASAVAGQRIAPDEGGSSVRRHAAGRGRSRPRAGS